VIVVSAGGTETQRFLRPGTESTVEIWASHLVSESRGQRQIGSRWEVWCL